MNIILLVTIIGILFGLLSLLDRRDRARGVYRAPLGSDLGHDRDVARLRTELDANVDTAPGSRETRSTHRHAA